MFPKFISWYSCLHHRGGIPVPYRFPPLGCFQLLFYRLVPDVSLDQYSVCNSLSKMAPLYKAISVARLTAAHPPLDTAQPASALEFWNLSPQVLQMWSPGPQQPGQAQQRGTHWAHQAGEEQRKPEQHICWFADFLCCFWYIYPFSPASVWRRL